LLEILSIKEGSLLKSNIHESVNMKPTGGPQRIKGPIEMVVYDNTILIGATSD
jgi:hypothetical protein